MKTLNINADIPANRELRITLPDDVPTGPAEIVVIVSPGKCHGNSTFGALAESDFFGIWKDRQDVTDSIQFSQDLRSKGWKRSPE
jgi:hypothetical protein